jgi:hypothetical protein
MKTVTIIFMILIAVAIAIYDVIAIIYGGTEASISSHLIVWSYEFPAATFLFGFLCGHLFWRMKGNKDTRKIDNQ